MNVPVSDQYFKAIDKYSLALLSVLTDIRKQIKNQLELLRNDFDKNDFTINDKTISLRDFTLLLGNMYFVPEGFSLRSFFSKADDKEKKIRELEDYLLSIPGVVLPEIPDFIKKTFTRN